VISETHHRVATRLESLEPPLGVAAYSIRPSLSHAYRAAPTSEVVTESFLLVRLPRMSFVYQHTLEPLPEIPCTLGESVIRFKSSYTQLPVE
jgi:hypothetical protein